MSSLNTVLMKLDPSMVSNPYALQAIRSNLNSIIVQHSVTAAVAGMAGGILPGIGGILGCITSGGAIWSMYYRICKELGIGIQQNILKALGSAVTSNIATQIGGVIILDLALSFVPGVAIPVCGAACYGVTYLAGYLFIKMIVDIFGAGGNPDSMTEEELKAAAEKASRTVNCKDVYSEAAEAAKGKIKNGEIRADSEC